MKRIINSCAVIEKQNENDSVHIRCTRTFPTNFSIQEKQLPFFYKANEIAPFYVVVFTSENSSRQFCYCKGIDKERQLVVYSNNKNCAFFDYILNILCELYISDVNKYDQCISFLYKYIVSDATRSIEYPLFSMKYSNFSQKQFTSIVSMKLHTLLSFQENSIRTIYAAMLNERRMIVIGDNRNETSLFIMALLQLIQPLTYEHVLITSLPSELSSLIESPTPYIIGIERDMFEEYYSAIKNDVIVIDINKFTISSTNIDTVRNDINSFPKQSFDKLITEWNLLKPEQNIELVNQIMNKTSRQMIKKMIKNITHTLMMDNVQDSSTFSKEKILSMCDKDVYQFMKSFIHTSFFDQFVENYKKDLILYPIPKDNVE